MAKYNLVLPAMGEGVMEATVTAWLKNVGDRVEEDESIAEVATDKVDTEVPSPVSGLVKEILIPINDVVQVNQTMVVIETEGEEEQENTTQQQAEPEPDPNVIATISKPLADSQLPTESDDNFFSPLVKSMIEKENITTNELNTIQGTGKNGRITKEDIISFLNQRSTSAQPTINQTTSNPSANNPIQQANQSIQSPHNNQTLELKSGDELIEMDRMRKLIAQHMVQSKRISPHVTSFVETDMTNVVKWRNQHKDAFLAKEGVKLTFMPIIIHALVKAIKDFPMINISVNEDKIIKKKDINIGMATALANGNLIVPVIKNADQYNLTGLAKKINDLAQRARQNTLKPDEIKGGTYTITNIGSFGNILGTPIINQPQVAIMAIGSIQKKPAVIETPNGDLIGVRHKMYLSHAYDHRVVDGALGGMFVKKVADYLENFDLTTNI